MKWKRVVRLAAIVGLICVTSICGASRLARGDQPPKSVELTRAQVLELKIMIERGAK